MVEVASTVNWIKPINAITETMTKKPHRYFFTWEILRKYSGIKKGKPGRVTFDFLNHWRMRVSNTKVPPKIDELYNKDTRELSKS